MESDCMSNEQPHRDGWVMHRWQQAVARKALTQLPLLVSCGPLALAACCLPHVANQQAQAHGLHQQEKSQEPLKLH
jgi:hypothetical protein